MERWWSISLGRTVISKTKEVFGSMPPEEVQKFKELGVDFEYIEKLNDPGYYSLAYPHLLTLTVVMSVLHEKVPWDKRILNTLDKLKDMLLQAKEGL